MKAIPIERINRNFVRDSMNNYITDKIIIFDPPLRDTVSIRRSSFLHHTVRRLFKQSARICTIITENFHQEYSIHSSEILSPSRNNTHYIKIRTHLIAIDAVVIHRTHTALISTSFSRNAIYYPRYIHEKRIDQPASKLVCTHRIILVYGISKRLATAANEVQTCFVRPLHSYTFRNVLSFNNTRFERNRAISGWLDRVPRFEFYAKMRFVLKLYVLMMDSFYALKWKVRA